MTRAEFEQKLILLWVSRLDAFDAQWTNITLQTIVSRAKRVADMLQELGIFPEASEAKPLRPPPKPPKKGPPPQNIGDG